MNTRDGLLTLDDKVLFKLFIRLERSVRGSDFDEILKIAQEIEEYLLQIRKHQIMAFVYLYLKFGRFTPHITEREELLDDQGIKKSYIFRSDISEEERLIGLWANVKYEQVGQRMLRVVYRSRF